MRIFLKKLYDKSEAIIGTGHSFIFVTDFEREKFKEIGYMSSDFSLKDKSQMTQTECKEISALLDSPDKIPFFYGRSSYDGKLHLDEPELKVLNEIQKYKRTRSKPDIVNSIVRDTDNWDKLSQKHKDLILQLIDDFALMDTQLSCKG